jgi:hypothetical protein
MKSLLEAVKGGLVCVKIPDEVNHDIKIKSYNGTVK